MAMGRQGGSTVPTEGGPSAPSSRQPAGDFQLTDLNGNLLQRSSLQGKVILLDFWATWCPPCLEELPHFKELYAAYRDRGLEIIGVSLDEGGVGEVKSFVQRNGVSYPVAMSTPQVIQAYGGVRGIPTTFLIDKQGRIAKKVVGYQSKQAFESQIQTLLAE